MLLAGGTLFVHAPKTAGTTVVEFLVRNLPGEKVLTMPQGHAAQSGARIIAGKRHENLAEALEIASGLGCGLANIKLILGVIRNPYDLEVSRYAYFRLGHPWDKGRAAQIARSGDFDRFCREAGYPWGRPTPIESWYTVRGVMPQAMRLIRFENLDNDLPAAVASVCAVRHRVPHRNATVHPDWRNYVNETNEPVIYDKYRWLFQFYERFAVGGRHADDAMTWRDP